MEYACYIAVNFCLSSTRTPFDNSEFPGMYQFATVARRLATEFGETAQGLVVRIVFELLHDSFVAEVFQLLEDQ